MSIICGECNKKTFDPFLVSCNMCTKSFKKGESYICFKCKDDVFNLKKNHNAYGYYCSDKCLQEFNNLGLTSYICLDDEDRTKIMEELNEYFNIHYQK